MNNANIDDVLEDNVSNDEFNGTHAEDGGAETKIETGSDLPETDGSDGSEGGADDGDDEARQNRRQSQIDRLKEEKRKLQEELEDYKKGGKEGNQKGGTETGINPELVERTYLSANGVGDRDAQDEVLRLSKKLGMSVDAAMQDADIAERAKNLIKKKADERKVAGTTGGASRVNKGIDFYADQYRTKGVVPEDPKLAYQVLEHLKNS